MQGTDEVLAERAKRGSREAFEALVTTHQGRMYGLALQLLRNPADADAEDAAQEAFARCYAKLSSYDPHQSFGAWLYRIGYNHCLDVLRRRKRAPAEVVDHDDGPSALDSAADPGPGVEELVLRGESARTLNAALERLSTDHRRTLVLRYGLDMSYAEIGGILEVPESTVTMRLYHAKRALRTALRHEEEDLRGASS